MIFGLMIISCNDFLDVAPQGAITEEELASNPQAAENLVTGVYNGMWEGNVHGFPFISMTNIASDDADKGSTPDDGLLTVGRLDALNMDPGLGTLNEIWTGYYGAIARANQALAGIPLSPADESVKARLEAEVRFLRAYFYFNLVRFFGGVPKLDRIPPTSEINNPEFQKKASKEEIYSFIISDLQFAMENLPVKGQTQVGRATKGAATGMLAKVYLYQQNWQRAFNLTDSIVTGKTGSYDLLPQYQNVWREAGANSVESLFEVLTGVNNACNAAISNYSFSQGPRGGGDANLGWGFSTPSESLLNSYEAGDNRRGATIIFINKNGSNVLWDGYSFSGATVVNDRYNYKAYHSRAAENSCSSVERLPKNLRILRFGEILLIHAEAAFALGNAEAARTDLNRLRGRAGLRNLSISEISRDRIWHERRVELAMEHDRYFDLVRQEQVQAGRAVQAFADHGKTWTKNRNEVFPIPATQIQLSGGQLVQNQGY